MDARRDLTRRDFLRVAARMPLAALAPLGRAVHHQPGNPQTPNIIVLVFDAWAAGHLPMYGYARQTMPNLELFAQRAVVYHRHYSAGTFTAPGTVSLLTGLLPPTHRMLALGGQITAGKRALNAFHLVSDTHHTLGYSQNEYADLVLDQMRQYLDEYPATDILSLQKNLLYSLGFLKNDVDVAHDAFENGIFQRGLDADGSLFLGPLRRLLRWRSTRILDAEHDMTYPRGLPANMDLFRLEDVVDGAIDMLTDLPAPSFAYLHFYPPHGFYRPKGKFARSFDDGWKAPDKPVHPLSVEAPGREVEETQRLRYDQYLASWDAELSRLFEHLRSSGLVENSYIFITSDHGEMFERGVVGHYTPLIFDPLVRVPLIVARPGRTDRIDVHAPTSSVDLLPTWASLAGVVPPAWAEGSLLPEFGGTTDEPRGVYTFEAKTNSAFAPLTKVSVALTKGSHRLTYYQYPDKGYTGYELYDLLEDPEEMQNLYAEGSSLSELMKEELMLKLGKVNRAQ